MTFEIYARNKQVRDLFEKNLETKVPRNFHGCIVVDYVSLREQLSFRKFDKSRRLLVHLEPRTVEPKAYLAWYLSKFGKHIAIGGSGISEPGWPVAKLEKINQSEPRLNRAIMIQANKFSAIPGELYSLRRRVIDSGLVDVVGPGWEHNWHLNLITVFKTSLHQICCARIDLDSLKSFICKRRFLRSQMIQDKLEHASIYKVAVVVENSLELCTEKIYDAIRAGCIPVYVGPEIEENIIPSYFYFRAAANVDSISESIKTALDVNLPDFHSRVQNYLDKSPILGEEATFESLAKTLAHID